jgi:RNA polymerase sigma factor (sigma-70 family)
VVYSISYSFCSQPDQHRVRERAPAVPYGSGAHSKIRRWSDEEIARVRSVLSRLTSLRIQNDHDAEDLVQDTLLTMTCKCPEEDLDKGLLVWSMGILRKKVGNYYRRTQRLTNFSNEEMFAQKAGAGGWLAAMQESKIHHHELRAIIDVLLDSFPAREREAMELLLMGMPTHEIAAVLSHERYQNIANRLYRGRKKLARALARLGYRPRFVKAGTGRSKKSEMK